MIGATRAQTLANELGISFDDIDFNAFRHGVSVELRASDVSDIEAAQTAVRNLQQSAEHYQNLAQLEQLNTSLKTQWIRLADVFVIGPLMVMGGVSLTRKHPILGVVLGALGFGTIWFNGRNWLLVRNARRQLQ